MRDLWKILQGVFYIEIVYLIHLVNHIRFELLPILTVEQQPKMEEFLMYLYDNYFKSDASFPPQYWNYHKNILNTRIVDLTTNSLERINRKLKESCSTGHIISQKFCS